MQSASYHDLNARNFWAAKIGFCFEVVKALQILVCVIFPKLFQATVFAPFLK